MPSTPGFGPSDPIDPARRVHPDSLGDTRPDMLRLLVQEFLRHPVHNEAAEARFVTLAIRLIEAVEVPVAAKHIRELAPNPAMPRALALYLATAPLSLAGPVLRLSPVLSEADLADLAERAAPAHLAAIAARRDVSPALARRIAELVHHRREQGEREDSPDGTSEMAEEPAAAPSAAATVDDTGPAPPPVAVTAEPTEMSAAGDAEAETGTPGAHLPDPESAPASAIDFFAAGPEERAALIARLVTLPPLPLVERAVVPPAGFIDALLDAAKATGSGELARLIERTLSVTPENAARIVADPTGQAMAVAARTLGLSFAILSRVLFRLHPATGRSAEEMARLAEMFDSLPLASAQHLVASWRSGRRPTRERPEDAPSMRSYAVPYSAAQAPPETAEDRRRNG
ncbi:Uncharacterised protein [Starkeya nomas]|uniref:DUF2336 domain-containing protein n=1 Tax=Starkeya nomas TaxID=2666134 RepID=A0A5S9NES2_9HYPH|nr:DUF2336 domain-containing protein [Starkeya nomas]CAA0088018.1 Uncharacterised protein [Starkeya nomas]